MVGVVVLVELVEVLVVVGVVDVLQCNESKGMQECVLKLTSTSWWMLSKLSGLWKWWL